MAQGKELQNRKVFLDSLRVLATCAVVLLHTISGVRDNTDMSLYPAQQRSFLAVLDLVTWSVPVFLMISGYLFLNPVRQVTGRQMLFKYCRRMLLALGVFGVPYACIELVLTEGYFRGEMLLQAVVMVLQGKSWSHMWYLYLILILYFFTPAIRGVLKKAPIGGVYAVSAVLVIGSSIFPCVNQWLQRACLPVLPDFCIYLFYYICGYLAVYREEHGDKSRGCAGQRRVLPLLLLLLGLMMVCSRLLAGWQMQPAYTYPPTVFFSVLLFVWAASWQGGADEKQQGVLGRAAELCFPIYLIHPVYVNIAYKLLGLTPLAYPLWLSLPLFWLVIMLLSAGSAYLLRKITVLRRYIL